MKRRILFFVLSLAAIAAFLGCHAGGNSPMAPDNSATVVSPETRTVGTNGRFDDITFTSGAVIKCPNDKTFQEGVKVTATEEKVPVITDNSGKFSYIYVYNISAVLPSENSLTADVPVNTIEKPLSVSLPNDSTAGTCYIGTRASEKDPWRYSLATDGINSNARFIRLSANTPKTCTFNLYRLNIQFRLFVFDNEEKKDEVQVDTIAMVPADDVEIKDGKYTGKLTVKLNVEGDNLNGVKAEDLIAKITYRSENQQGANIDFTTNKNDLTDKAVTGSYEHSFEINNIKVENTLGNTAELSFELNLDGVSLDDFPKDFLVEFYSKGSDENTRPFEYTQTFSFETKENEPDPEPEPEPEPLPAGAYSIKYELNGGTLAEGVTNPRSYTEDSDTIVLNNPDKKGYTFTGWSESDNDAPQNPMSIVHGSKGDKTFIASYTPKNYIITLDPKGGTLKKDSIEYNIETEEFTLPTPTKDSYTFDGWTGSNGDTPERVVKIEKGTTGDKTYTANYSAVAYTITYTLGANDVINDNPTGFNSDTETFTLNEPTRTGYTFTGWTGSNGYTPQKEVTIAKGTTEKKSYTANWSINSYNLTLKKYRGSGVNTLSGGGLHEYNSEVTASCTLAAGFEFDSWFDSEGNKMPDKFKMPAKDLTLSAWGKPIVYKITYNFDNGALPQGVTNPTSYDVTSATITLNEPTKVGYEFIGWTGSNGDTPQKPVSVVQGSKSDLNYVANYSIVNYALTYTNVENCTFATANPTTYNVETETFTLTNPTKTGYEFTGWTYEGQTTPTVSVAIPQGSTGDREYTAHFNFILAMKIASDTGSVFEPLANNLYKLKPTFTITPVIAAGTVITDTEKNNILGAISVKDSNSTALNTISKSWENGKITLSFSEALTASSTYTISFDDIDGVNFTYTPLSFTTICFSGSGTSESPFLVSTAEQLDMVRKYPSYHFKQMNDITLTSANWTPIGKENYDDFYGIYDGNNHKITGLKIDNNGDSFAGLFWRIMGNDSNKAEIRNLTLENIDLKNGFSGVGSLAGSIEYADITNVKITGNINIDCGQRIGGLAGAIYNSSISDVHLSGNINIKGSSSVGGLAGQCSNVEFSRCSVDSPDGLISAGTGSDVGGLVGCFGFQASENGSISQSYSCIKVEGRYYVGGLVGSLNYCIIENSYSDCEIIAKELNQNNGPIAIGGLVGVVNADNARFTNCYSKGTIKIESTKAGDVGGLCGDIYYDQSFQNSTNSFTSVTINVPQDYTVSGYDPYNPANGVPLYYSDPAGGTYVYSPDESNHNYLSNGYPASGLTWSSDVWSGLSAGSYPKLKWQQ